MSKSLPRSMPPQGFRALTVFKSVGPEQRTFRVTDKSSAPYLRLGQYAVVDTADRDLQNGEAYLIQWNCGERKRDIVRATADRHGWWVGALRPFPTKEEAAQITAAAHRQGKVPVLGSATEGPYRSPDEIDYLKSRLLGRIVGVASIPLGELIAGAAGWENEDAGNTAFDPAKYVDVLLAAGSRPVVFYRENGSIWYAEYTRAGVRLNKKPERQRKKEEQSENDVREKCGRASTGINRVMDECIRRGLVERIGGKGLC
jgi:hypothetical protein